LEDFGRRAAECRVFLFAAVVLCAAAGCAERRQDLGAVREAYAGGKYEEALSLCERSIRKGNADGGVYYYAGMSLLAMGKDTEAVDRFREALRSDSALSDDIACALLDRARDSLDRGTIPRATLLARAAVEIDGAAPAGALGYLVAASYFEERDWSEAARWYAGSIAAYPDTDAAETGLSNLAASRAAMGDSAAAIEALEEQLERFPQGGLADRAVWTLASLLYDRARSEFERGDYGSSLRTAERVVAASPDDLMTQKAMFLIGESYERMGEFEKAYHQYEAIAREDRGAPGGIGERARAKMRGFRDAGLR
jgi:tetratricopeptide (TPR) repeat protein